MGLEMSQSESKTAKCPTGDPDCGCADFQAEACLHDQPVANPASGRNFDLAFVMRDCGGDIEKAQRRIDLALDARDEEVKRLQKLADSQIAYATRLEHDIKSLEMAGVEMTASAKCEYCEKTTHHFYYNRPRKDPNDINDGMWLCENHANTEGPLSEVHLELKKPKQPKVKKKKLW